MKPLNYGLLAAGLIISPGAFAQNIEAVAAQPAGMKPSACFTEEVTVWSCQQDARILSVCSGLTDEKRTAQYRVLNPDGSLLVFPEKLPFQARSANVIFASGRDGATLSLTDGRVEYVFMSDTEDGSARVTYTTDGAIAESIDCTLSEDSVGSFQEDVYRKTYAPVKILPVDKRPAPDGFDTLLQTLQALELQGHLTLESGLEPLDQLEGKTAKAFVLDLRNRDSACKTTEEATCQSDHLYTFLKIFEGQDGTLAYEDVGSEKELDLSRISFSFARLPEPGTPIVFKPGSDTDFCEARAYPADWEIYNSSVQEYETLTKLAQDMPNTSLWKSLRAVMNRYDVHDAPSEAAEIIGTLDMEMAHFPSVDVILSADGKDWREVILPGGQMGYVSVPKTDLLKIGDNGRPCFRKKADGFVLTSVMYGGK